MIRAQKLLIDLSEEEKVDRYLASDYTGDYTKLDYGDIVEKDPMKDIKAYLDTKPNIKGVHVLIGVFVETFLDLMGTWDSNTRTIRYWGTGTERRDLMSYRKAAQYVAAVVLDPNAIGILKFLGDRKDIVEIAGDLEAVYKFKPALENYGSLEELYLRRSQKEGFEAAVASAIYFFSTGKASFGADIHNSTYPDIKPESLRDLLQRHITQSREGPGQ